MITLVGAIVSCVVRLAASGPMPPRIRDGVGTRSSDSAEKNKQDWCRAVYGEAWKQYSHEDTLAVQRNNLFIIIQTALLAAIATTGSALLKWDVVRVGNKAFLLNYIVIGALMIVFSAFALQLLRNWKSVTLSGEAYVNLRWATCRRIEEASGVSEVSLASAEHELKKAIAEGRDSYQPYPEVRSLTTYTLESLGTIGWDSVHQLIRSLRLMWLAIGTVGVVVILLAFWLPAAFPLPGSAPAGSMTAQPAPITNGKTR
jgi:hypothetical protein